MDGWALGKTKVFLKYYHVEYLSKLYEDQVRHIFRVIIYSNIIIMVKNMNCCAGCSGLMLPYVLA
jgi:hypothetical protein